MFDNTPVGSNVTVVTADGGENARLVYSLVNIIGGEAFTIEESTGLIQTTIPFDREIFAGPYELTVGNIISISVHDNYCTLLYRLV